MNDPAPIEAQGLHVVTPEDVTEELTDLIASSAAEHLECAQATVCPCLLSARSRARSSPVRRTARRGLSSVTGTPSHATAPRRTHRRGGDRRRTRPTAQGIPQLDGHRIRRRHQSRVVLPTPPTATCSVPTSTTAWTGSAWGRDPLPTNRRGAPILPPDPAVSVPSARSGNRRITGSRSRPGPAVTSTCPRPCRRWSRSSCPVRRDRPACNHRRRQVRRQTCRPTPPARR